MVPLHGLEPRNPGYKAGALPVKLKGRNCQRGVGLSVGSNGMSSYEIDQSLTLTVGVMLQLVLQVRSLTGGSRAYLTSLLAKVRGIEPR